MLILYSAVTIVNLQKFPLGYRGEPSSSPFLRYDLLLDANRISDITVITRSHKVEPNFRRRKTRAATPKLGLLFLANSPARGLLPRLIDRGGEAARQNIDIRRLSGPVIRARVYRTSSD